LRGCAGPAGEAEREIHIRHHAGRHQASAQQPANSKQQTANSKQQTAKNKNQKMGAKV
jgi:hypothetical protein